LSWDADNDVLWKKIGYDTRMNVISEGKWYYNPLKPAELGKWVESSFIVDAYGNRTATTNPLGNKTAMTYEEDYHTFPQTITSPPNAQGVKLVTTEQYEPLFGTQIQNLDANGNTMRSEIDGFGRLINTYGPHLSGQETLISQVTYHSDTHGFYVKIQQRPAWETDNQNEWYWQKSYLDGLEREYRTEKRGQSDDTTLIDEIRYNPEGHIGQQSLPYFKKDSPSWINKVYDVYNRPTLTTAPDGTQEKMTYAQGGLQVSKIYAYNTPDARTETTYSNARDLVIRRVEDNELSTQYVYKKLDQLINLTTTSDSESQSDARTVTFVYDSLNRIVEKETSNTGVDLLEYDEGDNLLFRTDAEGNQLGFTYDKLNRVLTKTSTVGNEVTKSAFSYDESNHQNGHGNLTSVLIEPAANLSLQDWHYRFGYNAYDELISGQISMAMGTYSYAIEYDPMARMRKYTYPDGTTQVLDYAEDSNIYTLSMQGESGPYVTYSDFNALGEVEQISYKNGLNITRSHYAIPEALGKLKSIQAVSSQQSNQTLFSKHYQWNKVNAITDIRDSLDANQDESFGYHDDANNPKMGFLTKAEGGYETENYRYKKLGNLEQKNTTEYHYLIGTDQLVNDSEGNTFSYYNNGNLRQQVSGGTTWEYDYDAEGKLITTRQGEQSGHAFYDYNGHRIYHQPIGQSVKTYYVTPNYEVTDFGNGKVEHTKYIEGLFGRAVAMTNSGTGVASAIAQNNTTLQAKWFGETTGNSLFSFTPIGLIARFSDWEGNTLMIWPSVTHFLSHPEMAQWMNMTISSLVLIAGFLFCLLLIVRGASENSLIGKARIRSVCFLAKKGWISARQANLWQQSQQTNFGRDNPYKAAVLPFLVAIFFCTYGTMAEAALEPGDNGAGYPVQGTYYFVQNHVDSTVLVTDSQGAQTAQVAYLPFGEIDQNNSTGIDNFREKFSGKEWDSDKQLYYFQARYYAPQLAQFTTPDPAQQYINPYLYASNSPESHIDQNGELAFLIATIIIGAVIGAYMGAAAVNGGTLNPAEWDWKSGKTWAGLFGGAAIGAVSGAASAGLASSGSIAVSIAGHALLGAVESAAFTAMGGGSLKDVATSAAIGGAFAGLFAGIGSGISRIGAKRASSATKGGKGLFSKGSKRAASIVCSSFVEGTPVYAEGEKNVAIESIEQGDKLYAYNKEAGTPELHEVTALFERNVNDIVTITTSHGEAIETTAEHPFWVDKKGWIAAKELTTSDKLTDVEGQAVGIQSVEFISLEQPVTVHNFTVDAVHNYYVSKTKVLVKNTKCSRRMKALGSTPSKNSKTGKTLWKRWAGKGKARVHKGQKQVYIKKTDTGARQWVPLDRNIHMGHKLSAVDYWESGATGIIGKKAKYVARYGGYNNPGYSSGFKGKLNRQFMRDPENYRFEWGPLNSSHGASDRAAGHTYQTLPAGAASW
jgi:RHS repeat-associated protein